MVSDNVDVADSSRNEKERVIKKIRDRECSNMSFLSEILRNLHLTKAQVGRMTSYSQQLISWWFKVDNVSLFNLVDMFRELNYTLECQMVNLKPLIVEDKEKYSIEINGIPISSKRTADKTDCTLTIIGKAVKLKFLAGVILENKLTLRDFASLIEIPYCTVYSWFRHDDIKVSHIFAIAEKLNYKVSWKLSYFGNTSSPSVAADGN